MVLKREEYEAEHEKILEYYEKHKDEILNQHEGKVAVLTKDGHKITDTYKDSIEVAKKYYEKNIYTMFWKVEDETDKKPRSLRGRGVRHIKQT